MVPRIRKPYARIDTAGTAGCGTGRGTRPLQGKLGVLYMEKVESDILYESTIAIGQEMQYNI